MRKQGGSDTTPLRIRLSFTSKENADGLKKAGLLAYGSSSGRAFPSVRTVASTAAVLPNHSGGTAPDSHRTSLFGSVV